MSEVSVLIADHQPLFADALGQVLQSRLSVQLRSCSPRDLSSLSESDFDAVIVEPFGTPDMAGPLIQGIRDRFARARLMILTDRVDTEAVALAVASGAQSYVLKSEPLETIGASVELLCRGGLAFSLPVAVAIASLGAQPAHEQALSSPSGYGLTPRETQILQLIARGWRDGDIAETLAISRRTVQRHVANVLLRLGCRTRSEAVAKVLGAVAPLLRQAGSANGNGVGRGADAVPPTPYTGSSSGSSAPELETR